MSFQNFHDFKSQYEGVKAAIEADLSTIENCFGKCALNVRSVDTTDRETNCLRKCYVKYFDSALLVEKEMKHYVHGQPI